MRHADSWQADNREKVLANNPTLEKNLECIAQYNPKLKQDLLNLKTLTNHIELVQTGSGEPNLLYNQIPLHNEYEAEREAKDIFAKIPNTPTSMHVLFGIGLGYLFKEFCEQSKGIVIVYEPNLEILRVTLELVDFSAELSKQNVKIASDIPAFKEFFINNYSYKANSTFAFLSSYKQIYSNEMNEIFKQIEVITGICLADYNTLKYNAANSIEMMLKNIPDTLEETPLSELKSIYKDKTALIVSAGPSLDQNIEIIKKNRDKVIIFCVGTALKALIKNGITPDFLNVIELNDCSPQIEGLDLSDVNLILEPYTNKVFHKTKTKRRFCFPTNSSHANISWARLTGVDISPYTAKGTVSYEALFSAKMLGFNKIILIGQDLAYANNQCYSKYSAYPDLSYQINPDTNKLEVKIQNYENYVHSLIPEGLKDREQDFRNYANYKIKNLNDTLYFVKGISGEMLPTQGCYATFIEHFKEFAQTYPGLNLINSSMIGAHIEGFKNLPLETALEHASPIKDKPDLNLISYNYDKPRILRNLNREKENMKNILKEFEKAREYIFKYTREFQRKQTLTHETNKYFKLLLQLYNDIAMKYNVDSPLYQAISFAENMEVQYTIKNAEEVNIENIQALYECLKQYYLAVEGKLIKIVNLIQEQENIISRMV